MELILWLVIGMSQLSQARKPNVLFILADDLGYNDVSWHNPTMPTEALHKLAKEGVILEQAYAQQVCTPSRAALLTGKYPFHIGRQKRALKPLQPTGLAVNLTTLPSELKNLGYQTHMVGKWHLGYCAKEYTPTKRGFDSFLGFYLGSQNYFTHDRDYKTAPNDPPTFYDFRINEEVAKDGYMNQYSTEIFRKRTLDILDTVGDQRNVNAYGNYKPFFIYLSFQAAHAPLQAQSATLARIEETANPARDIYKAMVADMDTSVQNIVDRLKELDLYDDTIIIFSTDNGGAISHGASNWPLRGTKGTMFEGGTKAVSFVHGPKWMDKSSYTNTKLIHIVDWMPTILGLAGFEGNPTEVLNLDGLDQWDTISRDGEEVRTEMVYNLKVGPASGAIRIGNYKLLFGRKFNKQGWYDVDTTALQCNRMVKIKKDKKDKKDKRKKKKQRQKNKKKNNRVSKKMRNKDERRKQRKREKQEKKADKRERKQEERVERRKEKKLRKIWKDWLPRISPETENVIRLRMDDCNWEDFSDSGHKDSSHLIPRNQMINRFEMDNMTDEYRMVDIFEIDNVNLFNISATDEDSEFEEQYDMLARRPNFDVKEQLELADMALYNIKDDPEERRDLKELHPDIFKKLKERVLYHMRNIAPEDFPPQDFSGHPRNFGGNFSPGWCTPK